MITPDGQGDRRDPNKTATGRAREALAAAGIAALGPLSDRQLGESVTDRRSSWVRRLSIDLWTYYIKTYDYPRVADRVRGALRTTCLAAPRGAREWRALDWLSEHGFAAPRPVLRLEDRRWGWLCREVLVTLAWPGRSLEDWLLGAAGGDRQQAGRRLVLEVQALHRAGFRHRNLDPRNILICGDSGEFRFAFLDAPRHRLRPPSCEPADRDTSLDWQRLAPALRACGTAVPVA